MIGEGQAKNTKKVFESCLGGVLWQRLETRRLRSALKLETLLLAGRQVNNNGDLFFVANHFQG